MCLFFYKPKIIAADDQTVQEAGGAYRPGMLWIF